LEAASLEATFAGARLDFFGAAGPFSLSNFKFRFDFLKLLILVGPDASAGVAEFDVDCLLLVDAADVRIFCVAFTR
jgi:hypothetical protein